MDESACEEALRALPSQLEERSDVDVEDIVETSKRPIAIIHNIVSTSLIWGRKMPIDLHELAVLLPCSSYDRRRFAAITLRIDNPKCTALLFTSGKLVITGVKSWYECLLASICIAELLNSVLLHQRYIVLDCNIQNIVAHSFIKLQEGQILNLQALYEDRNMVSYPQPLVHPPTPPTADCNPNVGGRLPTQYVPRFDTPCPRGPSGSTLFLLRESRPHWWKIYS